MPSAYSANQRTQDGHRIAAARADVLGLVFHEAMRLAVSGVVIGFVLAAGPTRLIAGATSSRVRSHGGVAVGVTESASLFGGAHQTFGTRCAVKGPGARR